MWTALKLKKIKQIVFLVGLLTSLQLLAVASVFSLNDCPDMIFIDGLQNDSIPSGGSGGTYPGYSSRIIYVNPSLGNRTYYVYVPSSYTPSEAIPLVFLWHGAGGAGTAPAAAQSMRALWDSTAETENFIIVAQVATGTQGGGFIPSNAETILEVIINDMENSYNIESSRIYGWGFSSGGHVMHDIALDRDDIFAAYAVNAGVLAAAAGYTAPANANRILPVYVSVGNQDALLPYATTDQTVFLQAGWENEKNYWLDVFQGNHIIPANAPSKAWDKICISTILN